MKKSLVFGVFGGIVGLLAIAGISTYVMGLNHYKRALVYLGKNQWGDAKAQFALAKKDGVVFFQNGDTTYDQAINTYGTHEWQLAQKEFERCNFKSMEHFLAKIPKDASAFGKKYTLLKMDPVRVHVAGFVPTSVKITSTLPFMIAPNTPAIAVSGQQNNSGNGPDGEFYLLMYDKASDAYKVEFTKSGQWQTYVASYGNLFGDDRNALVLQDEDGGSGAMDDERMMVSDPQQTLGFGTEDVFIGQKPGDSQITIVPNGGYDWSHAVTINVTVLK